VPGNTIQFTSGVLAAMERVPVGVVTRNRHRLLDVTLRSLSATLPAGTPLVVFDDASEDARQGRIASLCLRSLLGTATTALYIAAPQLFSVTRVKLQRPSAGRMTSDVYYDAEFRWECPEIRPPQPIAEV